MKYETDSQTNSDSEGKIEVEITFVDSTNLLFDLDEPKHMGEEKKVCLGISSKSNLTEIVPSHVRIRQSYGNDAWGVRAIQIQQYPGSGLYSTYALYSIESRFWTDGDNSCMDPTNMDGLMCCHSSQWCDMMVVADGNY